MSLVLHLSDTHFGTERSEVSEALLRLALEVRPDVAILSGDITQRARREQFAAARRFLETLAAPVKLVIPGNHDIPLFNLAARLFNPYGNYRRAFGYELEPQFSSKDLLVIGVNTIFVLRDCDNANLLHGHTHAIKAWATAGADLVLSGHIHMAYVRNLTEQLHDLTRPLWTASAGTAISKRVRDGEPNSVNLIRYDPAEFPYLCKVDQLDFDATSSRFIIAKTTLMELS